jgi:DNA repair protein RadC
MEGLEYLNGHRERLRGKFLKGGYFEDYELLELLLFYAIPRSDVKKLAKELLAQFGSLADVLSAPIDELQKISGIKESTAVLIKLFAAISNRKFETKMKAEPIFYDIETMYNYCKNLLNGKTVEEVHILYLDSKFKLIKSKMHANGTVDENMIYVREIVKDVIALSASNIIIVHNHPSGINYFSDEDINITKKLIDALHLINVRIFDHILVSNGKTFSMKEIGLVQF